MTDVKPFAGLSQEETNQGILYLLGAILEKLPRIDANDRLVTNPSEVAPASTPVTGTLSSVTTVATVSVLAAMGANNAPLNATPMHIANAGANYLYDRIIFS